jgi:CubicO group peptidase (beta-lactamase class C family)
VPAVALARGLTSIEPERRAMTADTIFDPASLTKVAAAKAAIMRLAEKDKIALDHPVSDYSPEFARNGRAADTVS